jgi:hypothetical protein
MNYPKLNEIPTTRDLLDKFKGYNHNLRIGEGEFYDMKNLTGDDYPILSPRKKRGTASLSTIDAKGMGSNAKFCYVDGQDFHMVDDNGNNETYDLKLAREGGGSTEAERRKTKTLISIGSNVVVMPDQKYINTVNPGDRGTLKSGIYEVPDAVPGSGIRAKIGVVLLEGIRTNGYYHTRGTESNPNGNLIIVRYGEKFPENPRLYNGTLALRYELDGSVSLYEPSVRTGDDGFEWYWKYIQFDKEYMIGIYPIDDDEVYWNATVEKLKAAYLDSTLKKTSSDTEGFRIIGLEGFYPINKMKYGALKSGDEMETHIFDRMSNTVRRAIVLKFMHTEELVIVDGEESYGDYMDPPKIPMQYFLFGRETELCKPYIIEATLSLTFPHNANSQIPEMDHVIESGNRLWGCRYGKNNAGEFVNEIYASRLGDFKDWAEESPLTSMSPYVINVGTSGKFTGAINYGGKPIFFKEDCMHRVFGDYTPYSCVATPCKGVQEGCSKSLVIVNDVLYYKSRTGICAYDGSLPVEISENFGDKQYSNAVGGTIGNKYYVSMKDIETDDYVLFVYDTIKRMWHKEDNTEVTQFCNHKGELYYIDRSDRYIHTIKGTGAVESGPIKWGAETGILGATTPDDKYVTKIDIRMSVAKGSKVSLHIEYDSMGEWERLMEIEGLTLNTFTIPVRPRRCDHFRLKFEGEGDAKIFSISKTLEETE